jgi:hypothetical protein
MPASLACLASFQVRPNSNSQIPRSKGSAAIATARATSRGEARTIPKRGTVMLPPGSPSSGGGPPWLDPPPAVPGLVTPATRLGADGDRFGERLGDGLGDEPGSVCGGLGPEPTGSDGIGKAGRLTAGRLGVGRIGGTLTGRLGVGRERMGSGVVDGKGSSAPPARVLAWAGPAKLKVRADAGKISAASAADVPHPARTMTKNRPGWAGPTEGLAGFTDTLLRSWSGPQSLKYGRVKLVV